jgi:predicted YcjX-like family ATPase
MPDISWAKIKKLRNVVVHEYLALARKLVRVDRQLPQFAYCKVLMRLAAEPASWPRSAEISHLLTSRNYAVCQETSLVMKQGVPLHI